MARAAPQDRWPPQISRHNRQKPLPVHHSSLLCTGPATISCIRRRGSLSDCMQAATSRFSAVLSVKKTESIRAARRWSPLATSFATTFDRFAALGTRKNTGDSVKSETAADNKRHTNAHRPFTSHSPTGSTIPPPPPLFKNGVNMRLFAPCYCFSRIIIYLSLLTLSVISGGSPKFGRVETPQRA